MKKNIKWLFTQIDKWVENEIIDISQARAIRNLYPDHSPGYSWGIIILSIIGAIIFGLGVILLFAYNWDKMPKEAKLGLVFISLFSAHGTALIFYEKKADKKPLSEGLHVLGTMLFGAGIWLVAQIYHMGEHYPNAFVIWGLGALALAWAIPSVSQGILASIILAIWNGCEVFAFRNPQYLGPIIIIAGIIPLCWLLRSKILALIGIFTSVLTIGFTLMPENKEVAGPVLFYLGAGLIALGIILENNKKFPEISPILSFVGYLPYLGIIYLLCFKNSYFLRFNMDTYFCKAWFWVAFTFSAIAWGLAKFKKNRDITGTSRIKAWLLPVAIAFFTFHILFPFKIGGWFSAGVYNLIFLTHAIIIILEGGRNQDLKRMISGCILFAIIVMSRYTDLFHSLIARAIVFFIIGAGIFMAANLYSRSKKQSIKDTP